MRDQSKKRKLSLFTYKFVVNYIFFNNTLSDLEKTQNWTDNPPKLNWEGACKDHETITKKIGPKKLAWDLSEKNTWPSQDRFNNT